MSTSPSQLQLVGRKSTLPLVVSWIRVHYLYKPSIGLSPLKVLYALEIIFALRALEIIFYKHRPIRSQILSEVRHKKPKSKSTRTNPFTDFFLNSGHRTLIHTASPNKRCPKSKLLVPVTWLRVSICTYNRACAL